MVGRLVKTDYLLKSVTGNIHIIIVLTNRSGWQSSYPRRPLYPTITVIKPRQRQSCITTLYGQDHKYWSNTFMTSKELTMNDSYLITKKKENDKTEIIKLSYRSNLINTFRDIDEEVFSKIGNLNVNDICQFRKIVSIAYDNKYNIFQLTRL